MEGSINFLDGYNNNLYDYFVDKLKKETQTCT